MARRRRRYSEEYRERMIELVRSGRTPEELSREFQASASAIRKWVKETDRAESAREDLGARQAESARGELPADRSRKGRYVWVKGSNSRRGRYEFRSVISKGNDEPTKRDSPTQPSVGPPPENFTATPISDTTVKLTWDAVTGADGYEVRTREGSGGWGSWFSVGTRTAYLVSGLTPDTVSNFEIRTIKSTAKWPFLDYSPSADTVIGVLLLIGLVVLVVYGLWSAVATCQFWIWIPIVLVIASSLGPLVGLGLILGLIFWAVMCL